MPTRLLHSTHGADSTSETDYPLSTKKRRRPGHKSLKPLLSLCALLLMAISQPGTSQAQGRDAFLTLPDNLVACESPQGRQLFQESKTKESFWHLAQFYATQPDLGSCSVASCTMVLNALPIPRPVSPAHKTFRLFTPENFFSPAVSAICSREKVSSSGMTLDQLVQTLATYPITVECRHASSAEGISAFRHVLGQALQQPDQFIVVNYLRKSLGQQFGGHISPVGAFHEGADRVLILDVSNYKYPWVWVKTEDLWQAMSTVDDDSKLPRGYAIIGPVKSSP